MWDDPFENFVLNSTGITRQGELFAFGFKDRLYGQCWTLIKDSDALWRIYSPDKQGVRVRTTIGMLYDSLYSSCGEFRDISCFIGKVQYKSQRDLIRLFEHPGGPGWGVLDPSGRGQAETLMFKRKEFGHEKEVRLVYHNHDEDYQSDVYQYPCEPTELIDQVTFDPRISDEMFTVFSRHVEEYGFSKKQITRSPLYSLPKLKVQLDGV